MVAGRTHHTPALLLALIENLPEDAATVAEMRGGPEFRGWTRGVSVQADLYDAVMLNTQATGRWRKHPPKFKPYPRPRTRRSRMTKISDLRARYGAAPTPTTLEGVAAGGNQVRRARERQGQPRHQAVQGGSSEAAGEA